MTFWIEPQWPAPLPVRAVSTLRTGGVSEAPYDSLNLGLSVGDDPQRVMENRLRLMAEVGLPAEPLWLRQVHGIHCVRAGHDANLEADAAWTDEPAQVLAVLSADCLPILLCNDQAVAAVHAGWRGLCGGVIEQTVAVMSGYSDRTVAWLAPAIGANAYEVGEDVLAAATEQEPKDEVCFTPVRSGHWLLDLYGLAQRRLARLGVTAVSGGDYCTHSEPERFFSFRRDGQTGRMASLIWIADQ